MAEAVGKCNICGAETPPDQSVCVHCNAALERAYHTVPPVAPAAAGLESRRARSAPSVAGEPPPPHVLRSNIAIVALAMLALMAAMYLAYRLIAHVASKPAETAAPASAATRKPEPAPAASAGTIGTRSSLPATDAKAPRDESTEPAPPVRPQSTADGDIPPPARTAQKPSQRSRATLPTAGPVVETPLPLAAPPLPQPAAAAPPEPVPSPAQKDRWQQMTEAIDKCSGNLLARALCEQRTRIQFCEGHWGDVAQCPGGPTREHG